jgi:hypothetical protein
MHIITMESSHSTWIFDPRHLRFCRILRGIAVGQRISTEWRPYWQLEIDPHDRTFTVFLNEQRSRLIRASIRTSACVECAGERTSEVSLEDIRSVVA